MKPLLMLPLLLAACSITTANGPAATTSTAPFEPDLPSAATASPCGGGTHYLPPPSGPHRVGLAELDASQDLGHLTAYYPAANCAGAAPPYLRPEISAALALDPVKVGSIVVPAAAGAAPASGSPRAVVVLMPGWTSLVALSTSLATDLASHGYVVVTADPPLGSEVTTFPDEAAATRRLDTLSRILDLIEEPGFESIVGRVDRSRVAAGGHSYAGSVAFQLAQRDNRISAAFDLDGVLHGDAVSEPMGVPCLILAASDGSAGDPSLTEVMRRSPDAVGLVVADAGHYDLTDVPLLTVPLGPLAETLAQGRIGPEAVTVTNRVVRRFLDCAIGHPRSGLPPCRVTAESLAAGMEGVSSMAEGVTR